METSQVDYSSSFAIHLQPWVEADEEIDGEDEEEDDEGMGNTDGGESD